MSVEREPLRTGSVVVGGERVSESEKSVFENAKSRVERKRAVEGEERATDGEKSI